MRPGIHRSQEPIPYTSVILGTYVRARRALPGARRGSRERLPQLPVPSRPVPHGRNKTPRRYYYNRRTRVPRWTLPPNTVYLPDDTRKFGYRIFSLGPADTDADALGSRGPGKPKAAGSATARPTPEQKAFQGGAGTRGAGDHTSRATPGILTLHGESDPGGGCPSSHGAGSSRGFHEPGSPSAAGDGGRHRGAGGAPWPSRTRDRDLCATAFSSRARDASPALENPASAVGTSASSAPSAPELLDSVEDELLSSPESALEASVSRRQADSTVAAAAAALRALASGAARRREESRRRGLVVDEEVVLSRGRGRDGGLFGAEPPGSRRVHSLDAAGTRGTDGDDEASDAGVSSGRFRRWGAGDVLGGFRPDAAAESIGPTKEETAGRLQRQQHQQHQQHTHRCEDDRDIWYHREPAGANEQGRRRPDSTAVDGVENPPRRWRHDAGRDLAGQRAEGPPALPASERDPEEHGRGHETPDPGESAPSTPWNSARDRLRLPIGAAGSPGEKHRGREGLMALGEADEAEVARADSSVLERTARASLGGNRGGCRGMPAGPEPSREAQRGAFGRGGEARGGTTRGGGGVSGEGTPAMETPVAGEASEARVPEERAGRRRAMGMGAGRGLGVVGGGGGDNNDDDDDDVVLGGLTDDDVEQCPRERLVPSWGNPSRARGARAGAVGRGSPDSEGRTGSRARSRPGSVRTSPEDGTRTGSRAGTRAGTGIGTGFSEELSPDAHGGDAHVEAGKRAPFAEDGVEDLSR